MGLGCLSGPKSKLGLPTATMELDKSLNQSPQGGLEKIGYTSSNGPSRNYCEVPNKYLIGHGPISFNFLTEATKVLFAIVMLLFQARCQKVGEKSFLSISTFVRGSSK